MAGWVSGWEEVDGWPDDDHIKWSDRSSSICMSHCTILFVFSTGSAGDLFFPYM
eukprot:COSAG05_NODE_2549_length_2914_cov_2.931794_2_plen_54_part_00